MGRLRVANVCLIRCVIGLGPCNYMLQTILKFFKNRTMINKNTFTLVFSSLASTGDSERVSRHINPLFEGEKVGLPSYCCLFSPKKCSKSLSIVCLLGLGISYVGGGGGRGEGGGGSLVDSQPDSLI